MRRPLAAAVLAIVVASITPPGAAAQAPLHEPQYSNADIAYGLSLYTARCATCHGPQGDAAGGVNLRSGKFRNAVTDQDLARFIRAGSPAGMPANRLDKAQLKAEKM